MDDTQWVMFSYHHACGRIFEVDPSDVLEIRRQLQSDKRFIEITRQGKFIAAVPVKDMAKFEVFDVNPYMPNIAAMAFGKSD